MFTRRWHTRRRSRSAAALIAAACLLSGCATLGRPATTPCQPGAAPRIGVPGSQCSVKDFHFNGVTRQPSPSVSFPQATAVRVVVTDANPFLYAYQVEAKGQRITEASITEFLKFAYNINFPKAAAAAVAGGAPAGAPGIAPDGPPGRIPAGERDRCEISGREEAFIMATYAAGLEHRRIADGFDRIQQQAAQADARLDAEAAVYLDPARLADDVQRAALDAVNIHDGLAAAVGGIRDHFRVALPAWTATVAALNREAAELDGGCPEVQQAVLDAAVLARDTAAFRASLESVNTAFAQAAEERRLLHATASDPGRFYHTAILERYDAPADVTVIVRRKALAPKDTFHHVASQRINVGGRARFSFSAGVGWTSVGTTTYGVSRRLVTPGPGSPNDTVNAFVVAKENSDDQMFPMVTFNTRLLSLGPVNTQLVLGVGMSRADAKALPGYLLGLGVDTFGQRVVLTGGVFFGEEHRLSGGLRTGDRVPGSLESVPMERRMVGKLGIGLTYRIFQ